jgi:4-hydroxy-tetrahydrodipicolinate reductase
LIKIAVAGIGGRMGGLIAKEVLHDHECMLSVVTSRNLAYCGDLQSQQQLTPNFDVLIDFSLPVSVINNLQFCLTHQLPIVIGSTGFSDLEIDMIKQASQTIPILKSNNMSIGANALNLAVNKICSLLDESWHIAIEESHHKTKRDTPSGTALMLNESIRAAGFPNEVAIHSIRDEQTIGVHKIKFTNELEYLELQHTALSREIFARGAIRAAKWLVNQKANLFDMTSLTS